MFNKEEAPARRHVWLAVSMCAPLAQVAGGTDWTTVLVTGVACFALDISLVWGGVVRKMAAMCSVALAICGGIRDRLLDNRLLAAIP